MIKLIILIAWVYYSLAEGKRDGYFYHYRNTTREPMNEDLHGLYMVERFIFILLSFLLLDQYHIIATILFLSGLVLIFSFFHNGAYYLQRNRLDAFVYPAGWWSSSTSSKATLEFSLIPRILLLIIGACSITLTFYL